MPPQQIKQLLRSRGASMTAVAKVCDVTPQTVRAVVFRETKSRRIAMVIAEFLDRSLDELFPGMYPDRYRRNADAMRQMQAALMRIDSRIAEKSAATVEA